MLNWLRKLPARSRPGDSGVAVFESLAHWHGYLDAHRDRESARWQLAQRLSSAVVDGWPGQCPLCQQEVAFALPATVQGEPVNLREALLCPVCRLNARVRAGLWLARNRVQNKAARVYLTEQASPAFVWAQRCWPAASGSEFAPDPEQRRALTCYLHDLGGRGKVVFADVTNLKFADAGLDAVISFDVLEHVPDYAAALAEFARVLKPGGWLILTAPFLDQCHDTLVRARHDHDGRIEHIEPPEYHGDPLGKGVLCYRHFGWDLLPATRAAGFERAAMANPWRLDLGLPGGLWTLVAQR